MKGDRNPAQVIGLPFQPHQGQLFNLREKEQDKKDQIFFLREEKTKQLLLGQVKDSPLGPLIVKVRHLLYRKP